MTTVERLAKATDFGKNLGFHVQKKLLAFLISDVIHHSGG